MFLVDDDLCVIYVQENNGLHDTNNPTCISLSGSSAMSKSNEAFDHLKSQ